MFVFPFGSLESVTVPFAIQSITSLSRSVAGPGGGSDEPAKLFERVSRKSKVPSADTRYFSAAGVLGFLGFLGFFASAVAVGESSARARSAAAASARVMVMTVLRAGHPV